MAAEATAQANRVGKSDGNRPSYLPTRETFLRQLYLEQKRTERSKRPFMLMLLESRSLLNGTSAKNALEPIVSTLLQSTRETDTTGWFEEGAAIGTIFTELEDAGRHATANTLITRCTNALTAVLNAEQIDQLHISWHVFPDDWDSDQNSDSVSSALYPRRGQNWRYEWVKRAIDIAGSITAIILSAPLLLAVAAAVKLTSKGPVLFRQQRIGQYGKPFTFLKFRSMYTENDPTGHEMFVRQMILNPESSNREPAKKPKYKIENDPRVTPVGRFLRRTSLDEIPQFINVLLGDMSLVGPRPPIPYEVKCYDIWHRRRLVEVKPGITGLWQVKGRSSVEFNEMVRMDLQYARSWSLLLDLKLLLQTPGAVLRGDGAF